MSYPHHFQWSLSTYFMGDSINKSIWGALSRLTHRGGSRCAVRPHPNRKQRSSDALSKRDSWLSVSVKGGNLPSHMLMIIQPTVSASDCELHSAFPWTALWGFILGFLDLLSILTAPNFWDHPGIKKIAKRAFLRALIEIQVQIQHYSVKIHKIYCIFKKKKNYTEKTVYN